VPLVQRGETVGILEAFSTQPHAFAEEHMDSLMRLAELAEAAASEEADPQTQPAKSAGLSQLRHAIASSWENSPQLERRQRYHVVGVALAVLFLLSVVGWRVRHNSANGIASSQQLAAARNMQPITNKETPSITSGPALVLKPSPDHLSIQSNKPLVPRTAQPVSSTEVADSASRFRNAPAAVSPADVPPVPTNSSAGTAELVRLLSAPATLPSFRPLGFSGGVLVYKIQPLYPPQALLWRLGGTVVLQATIAEDGTVRDLKVMSGNPMLAGAAIEAVSHWRYRPLLLNGRPIQNQERISIDFKLPH
jgi:TonB family protein